MDFQIPKPNVVKLRPDAFPLKRGASKRPYCQHGRSLVDVVRRIVECETCGVDLDPIDILGEIANAGDWVLAMRKERAALEKTIVELEAEVKRLKAQKRRAT